MAAQMEVRGLAQAAMVPRERIGAPRGATGSLAVEPAAVGVVVRRHQVPDPVPRPAQVAATPRLAQQPEAPIDATRGLAQTRESRLAPDLERHKATQL